MAKAKKVPVVTVNGVTLAKTKCQKETNFPLSFDILDVKSPYKVVITTGPRGEYPLFGGKAFTTREAAAMFDILRMVRQLEWEFPRREPILKAEFTGEGYTLNSLVIPG
jgi:hypothetical protein